MSERRRRGPTAALPMLLALALTVTPAAAQEAPAASGWSEDALRQRLDSLTPVVQEVLARHREERRRIVEAAALRHPLDSIAVGPLLVVAPRPYSGEGVEAIRTAWKRYGSWVGDAGSLLADDVFVYTRRGSPRLSLRQPAGGRLWRVRPWAFTPGSRAAVEAAELRVGEALARQLPETLRRWAGGRLGGEPRDWTYRQLVTAPTAAGPACLTGDPAACARALGLSLTAGADARSLRDWYTDEEIRALVVHREEAPWMEPVRDERMACMRGAEVESCLTVLAERRTYSWIPAGYSARRSLLMHALEMGGAGSYERLRAAGEVPVAAALAAAAGRPVEALLAGWSAQLPGGRPERTAGSGGSPLAAVLWITLFAGLAIGSSRWRA